MTVRLFVKQEEQVFKEVESIELDFRPSKDDIINYEGRLHIVTRVEYGAVKNAAISAYLVGL